MAVNNPQSSFTCLALKGQTFYWAMAYLDDMDANFPDVTNAWRTQRATVYVLRDMKHIVVKMLKTYMLDENDAELLLEDLDVKIQDALCAPRHLIAKKGIKNLMKNIPWIRNEEMLRMVSQKHTYCCTVLCTGMVSETVLWDVLYCTLFVEWYLLYCEKLAYCIALWNDFRSMRTVLYWGMVPTVLWNGFRNLRTVLHCGMVSEVCVLYFIVEWYLLYCGMVLETCVLYCIVEWFQKHAYCTLLWNGTYCIVNGFRNLRTILHCGMVSSCVLYFIVEWYLLYCGNGFRNLRTVLHCGMVSEACVLYFIVEWYLLYCGMVLETCVLYCIVE
ncbi:uncharacterized protein CEXT_533941 [Caerostris extrusa]|uniref:Odorant receptor n=1 Tax=Caerostris extrusa TaxID=172846 RepID=A0AAV4P0T8_CAEEX|nr:uncharacterized protein CEXT_533941 [Caerostris extrusa]